jgi:hypothetical protein
VVTVPRPTDFAEHHRQLLELRNSLLAHNDLSSHRATMVWTKGAFHPDRALPVEARSPISAAGAIEVRELFTFQRDRFTTRLDELVDKLQELLDWPPGEVHLERELERLTTAEPDEG